MVALWFAGKLIQPDDPEFETQLCGVSFYFSAAKSMVIQERELELHNPLKGKHGRYQPTVILKKGWDIDKKFAVRPSDPAYCDCFMLHFAICCFLRT